MKAGLYWAYATRSLVRGGQRTLLAIFCVAVGVMAIVSLQLVANMVNNGLTTNVREGNGADVSVRSDIIPLRKDQLEIFNTLRSKGDITDYTAVASDRVQGSDKDGSTDYFVVRAVDPQKFPLSGAPNFIDPSDGTFAALLTGNTAVANQAWLDQTGYQKGDTVTVRASGGRTLDVTIGGVIRNTGLFRSAQLLIPLSALEAAPSTSGLPVTYSIVYVNVPNHSDAAATSVKKQLQDALPQVTATTTQDALDENKQNVQNIRYFLQVVGLLALLIGGIGIINTMQVLLRRRQTEIAMLKTAGYQRRDLYVMFGLEAGILGIVGGGIGALVGIGVSFLVKGLVEKAFFISLPNAVDPVTVLSGVAIGFFTALIFGLMPIVQASQIRPLAVLRGLTEGQGRSSIALSIALSALLAGLFFLLALSILQNLTVAVASVAGGGIFLLLLSLFFTVIVLIISRLPVPEGFAWWYVLAVLVVLAIAAAVTIVVPGFGILMLVIGALALVVAFLPRTGRSNVKLALRNIGRQRARTVTTLVALFVGVFAIGIVLVLGQNIKDEINRALSTVVNYNSFILAGVQDKPQVDQALKQVEGIQQMQVASIAQDTPLAVRGVPLKDVLANAPDHPSADNLGKQAALSFLSGIQGYDVASGEQPSVTIVPGARDGGAKGRNLDTRDANTNNVLMPRASSLGPLNLKLGDTFTVLAADGKTPVTATVVGFYSDQDSGFVSVFGTSSLVDTVSGGKPLYLYSLKLDPTIADQRLRQVQKAVPTAQTFSLVDLMLIINTLLNNLIVMLTAIASLAMIAGIIIIANAVALAMLERRRELGILKSVGFTSGNVLSAVLMENGLIGFTGAIAAMALVTLATGILAKAVFNSTFGVAEPIVLGLVGATALVCMVVAGFVAWNATRVRPLEVLRYE